MKKFWNNLPFFWKVYISAIFMIITVVAVAEFAEDTIPYITDYKKYDKSELQKLLDNYAALEESERTAMYAELRRQGIWIMDISLSELTRMPVPDTGEFSLKDILPESDEWDNDGDDDWTMAQTRLPGGRLVAMGLPEPLASYLIDALLWILIISAFAGIGGYCLSKFLTSRIRDISAATRHLAAGDLHARAPVSAEGGDELSSLARLFNRMVDNIQSVVENERRLLYDISHELRSPLARMRLSVDLARRSGGEKSEKYLNMLESDIGRMAEMMNAIMEQGKGAAAVAEIMDAFNLCELLEEITDLVNFESQKNQKNVRCVLCCDLPKSFLFKGNRSLLEQALNNVLNNAIRYSPSGARVELSAFAQNEGNRLLVISIRDYGPGVPEKDLENLFKPFYRIENSRDKNSGGIGLGLALTRQYINRHQGSVSALNASPGLEVRLELPL